MATGWVGVGNVTLSERSRHKRPRIVCYHLSEMFRTGGLVVVLALRAGGKWSVTARGSRVSLGGEDHVLKWVVVLVVLL